MNEREERDLVDAIARSWISTPYHDHGEVKGPRGGTDCAKLIKCVFEEAGLVPPITIPHYSPQFFLHQSDEVYLERVTEHAREVELKDVLHGDVALYKIGRCFAHGVIVIKPGWPHVVHAHYASRVVRRGFGNAVHLGAKILDVKFFTKW